MFFGFRKKKLAEEAAQKQAADLERAKAEQQKQEENMAIKANINSFYHICHMVKSLPKKRQVVVIQRKYNFRDKYHRNRCYLDLAEKLKREHRRNGTNYMFDHNDSIIAFYAPTRLTAEFERAILKFSKDGCRFVRIRYYR